MISEIIYGLAALFGPVIPILLTIWLSRRRHALRWVVLPPKSMMQIADEIAKDLSVTFSGRVITNLTKLTFILHNVGREPIDREMVVEPITWTGPGVILDVRIIASIPPVKLEIVYSDDSMLLSWDLFNQNCRVLIEVICESKSDSELGDVGSIECQIRRVPEINIKFIADTDEVELRNRIRRDSAHFPKILRVLTLPTMSLYLWRHKAYVIASYLSIYFGFVGYVVATSTANFQTQWAVIIGVLIFSMFFLSSVYIFHNPYATILRIRSRRRMVSD